MTDLRKVVGWFSGEFTTDRGEQLQYYRLFVLYPKDDVVGLACEQVKLRDMEVLNGVEIGDYVELYYNENKKCVMVNPVVANEQDLIDFGDKPVTVDSTLEGQ